MALNGEIVLSIIAYSFCSGTLLLLNKMTLHYLPYPSLVTTFQLVGTVALIFGLKQWASLPVDPIKWKFVVPYSYYIIAFSLGVYCNMKSLSLSNVETVIVFKSLSPCLVAFADAVFLGRELPSVRSWAALGVIVLGSIGYASNDEKFLVQGYKAYYWPFLYLLFISFEMAYGKALLKTVELKTLSGPVIYTNMLGIPPMMLLAAMGGEYSRFNSDGWMQKKPIPAIAWILLIVGCAAGTGIGYSSWWCRGTVSATSFSLIGVMNKVLTVFLNIVLWDQHAKFWGIMSLLLCLVGGVFYRQAPMRPEKETVSQRVSSDNLSVFDDTLSAEEAIALMEEEAPDLEGTGKRKL